MIEICYQIHFVLLVNRQGKVRLSKWYSTYSQKERSKVSKLDYITVCTVFLIFFILPIVKSEYFLPYSVYVWGICRYASLYFCMCVDQDDNELEILEIIHRFVEILDLYFGCVCELDLIFNFHKVYFILDELLIAGELQEASKNTVEKLIDAQDFLVESAKEQASSLSNIIAQATK
ncbi:AP-1 complex subunit sigma-2 [Nymphaea thermarum]|nr:AP-1 complex subunit sigma-2 [Nymphaea thermarum]